MGGQNRSGVYVHWASRKRERIYLTVLDNSEIVVKFRMLKLWWDGRHQPLTYTFEISGDLLVSQNGQLPFGFRGRLAAQLHIILRRISVAVIGNLCLGEGRYRHRDNRGHHQPSHPPVYILIFPCFHLYSSKNWIA